MKYLPLLWAGVARKRGRAILLLLQIVSAFVLFGTLQGLNSGIKQVIAQAHADRLFVANRVAAGNMLPVGLLGTIRAIKDVLYITPEADLLGTYQKSDQSVPVVGADVGQFLRIYDEIRPSPGAADALRDHRDGGIVGSALMHQYGWKIGDRIVLQTPLPKIDGTRDWTFEILGRYDVPDHPDDADSIIANFAYLNESRLTDRDRANRLVLKVDAPINAGTVSLAIDTAFANSDHATRTQSEADRLATQIQQTADLDYIVRGIVGAIFFALLLATGALMMQSVRERGSELAVLKTLGYSDRFLLLLILAESLVQCVSASAIGLALAFLILPRVRPQLTQLDVSHVPVLVLLEGIAFAALLALISACAPALRAARHPIAHALAKR